MYFSRRLSQLLPKYTIERHPHIFFLKNEGNKDLFTDGKRLLYHNVQHSSMGKRCILSDCNTYFD